MLQLLDRLKTGLKKDWLWRRSGRLNWKGFGEVPPWKGGVGD